MKIVSFEQVDSNRDGRPELAILTCNCVTDNDQLRVYDGDGDMDWSSDWQMATDQVNDTWVIDIGGDDRAELIIAFSAEGQDMVAQLYDDVSGDARVAYAADPDGEVEIKESRWWSLEVRAPGAWQSKDGIPSLNVSAALDKAAHSGFPFLNTLWDLPVWMRHDGEPDVVFQMHDAGSDGAAEDAVLRLLAEIPDSRGVVRSRAWVNEQGSEAAPAPGALFWPYLDFRPKRENRSNTIRYFDLPPRVEMDWEAASIEGFVLPGYPIGEGYHLQSMQYLDEAKVNIPDFEAPHAYYDLADNGDPFPELNVRIFYGYLPEHYPWQEIRYSWNQHNPGTMIWDYKIGLLGDHPIDELDAVDIAGYQVQMVPYEDIPTWVIGREWELSTFVAREHGQQWTSEGIYDWTPWGGANPLNQPVNHVAAQKTAFWFAAGEDDKSPGEFFNVISEGYRGEYSFVRPMKPELYLSAIDRRLHLLNAEAGLFTIDETVNVEYANLNQDEYIDRWLLLEEDNLKETLHYSAPYLFYSDGQDVLIKKIDIEESLFQTLPPRDHEEWTLLGSQLDESEPSFTADDFAAMFDGVRGPVMTIQGANIEGIRAGKESGIRFTLSLYPGFSTDGERFFDSGAAEAGDYIVSYGEDFEITPAVPGTLSLQQQIVSDGPVMVNEPGIIQVRVANSGQMDIMDIDLLTTFTHEGEVLRSEDQTFDAFAMENAVINLNWIPPVPGSWNIQTEIRSQGELVQSAENQIVIKDAPGGAISPALRAELMRAAPAGAFVIALVCCFIALLIFYLARQGNRNSS